MANDFVKTITTSNGTTYDIHDERLNVTAADAGKVVSVDSNGNIVLVDVPESGTKLYKHSLRIQYQEGGSGDNDYDLTLNLVSPIQTAITNYSSLRNLLSSVTSDCVKFGENLDGTDGIGAFVVIPEYIMLKGYAFANGDWEEYMIDSDIDGHITDNVTELQ